VLGSGFNASPESDVRCFADTDSHLQGDLDMTQDTYWVCRLNSVICAQSAAVMRDVPAFSDLPILRNLAVYFLFF
jgi:hypothetical protein